MVATAKKIAIAPEVAAVLRDATFSETKVVLPPKQLDRKLYDGVNQVLAAYGGKWDRRMKAHVFAVDPRGELAAAIKTGVAVVAPSEKNVFQAFYTPAVVAKQIIEKAQIEPGHSVLEPSAGEGALAEACRSIAGVTPFCLDLNEGAIGVLEGKGFPHELIDFLKFEPTKPFDRIVMNPPFTKSQDIDHVTHAFAKCLAPGGRLVAIMSPSWGTISTKKATAFRALVVAHGAGVIHFPAGTFKESGTNVVTCAVTLDKPRR